ncbi:uncharacterized protein LOC129582292 [Paramacrobiotus metropolitanus]|uniref:uncharacterized protein LOC129582292 n=1 Tax=Paramacrobiotus metropolitanus TaxID=2943436 RepID=UPI002445C3BC|nr:uncharacterized protein LOC129582292 [Paramacrobiotus metropolitanus]XP_055329762.1 uncharacterized protein LOC129582292 [Paramacrobiotus metropolitanus]
MFEPLIKNPVDARYRRYSNRPCGILIGQTGVGKTTLKNRLCNTNHLAGASEGSVTHQLMKNDVSVGTNSFSLIDTPGTDSNTDTFKHAHLLRAGLTATELNTLFIVVKYENKYFKMVDNYLQAQQPVVNFIRKIVILVSHMDHAGDPGAEFPIICQALMEGSPQVANIVFFSDRGDPNAVADLMYACMSNMEPQWLAISEEDFHYNFTLYQVRINMRKSFELYKKQVEAFLGGYSRLRDRVEKELDEDKDELFHVMIVQFKYDLDDLYDEFVGKHGAAMGEMDYYALCIEMQRENVKICDRFVNSVTPLMTYNLFDNTDPRNLIKACPFCGLVWWKTEGCDGVTTCGNRVSTRFDFRPRAMFRYALKWINGELVHSKKAVARPSVGTAQAPQSAVGKGCGRSITWSEIPKLNDEVLYKIFEVKTMDEVKSIMQNDGYKKARDSYVSSIDTTFHS